MTYVYSDLPDFITGLSSKDYLTLSDEDIKDIRYYIHSDGCTRVPDFHIACCIVHDFYYRTWIGLDGYILTRREADRRFRLHIQHRSRFGRYSVISWWRWAGVRLFAAGAWERRESCHN